MPALLIRKVWEILDQPHGKIEDTMNTFLDAGIQQDICKALSDLGFEEPTPVQAQVIPLMLSRQVDLVGLAQTGTGKTAAFGLPLIQLINGKKNHTQGLVLCPTRELCVQVTRDLVSYAKYLKGINILSIYGGASIEQQVRGLRRGAQVIVATPGRLNDLLSRGKADISQVEYVVFDEADEMLQMGFQEELDRILEKTPDEKNTLLFSATMSKEVRRIAGKYMQNPEEITIGQRNAGAEQVEHEFYMVQAVNRYPALKRIVDNVPGNYSIIFCRTRRETQEVADKLIQDGYNADALHGDLSQAQRDQVMRKFRSKSLQLLVATDVAARGLDVNDLTHVINYNLPDDTANYTHRSGRTGRAGRTGISVAIIHVKEQYKIKEIEKRIKKKFTRCQIPTGAEICNKQLLKLVDEVSTVQVDHEQIDPLYKEVAAQFDQMDREELIKKFLSLEFNRFLEYYKNAPDLNVRDTARAGKGKRERPNEGARYSNRNQQFTRFFINVGRRDGLMPQRLIGTINDVPGGGRIKVGKIEIMRNSSLMEADSRFIPQVLSAFQHLMVNGKPVSIEVAKGGNGKSRAPHGGMRSPKRSRAKRD